MSDQNESPITGPSWQPPSLESLGSLVSSIPPPPGPIADAESVEHYRTELERAGAFALSNIAASLALIATAMHQPDTEAPARVWAAARTALSVLRGLELKTRNVQDLVTGDPAMGTNRRIIPCVVLDESQYESLTSALEVIGEWGAEQGGQQS